MKPIALTAFAAFAAACASTASAHIVFTRTEAAPSAGYVGAIRVSHGCEGMPTLSITVTIPAGVDGAKPQPKAGWTVETEREPLAVPTVGEGGQAVTHRVKSITWRGRLPDDQYDEFGISTRLPPGEGPLYFPTVQTCEKGSNRWTEIPAAGRPWNSFPRPAPVINRVAPAPGPAHDMSAMPGMDHAGH